MAHLRLLPPLLAPFLLSLPSLILAHSNLAYIIINGSLYHGYDPRPNRPNNPARVGWSSSNADAGFVGPTNYTTPEIVCHLSAASVPAHAPVRAGDNIHVQWNGWPQGHPAPVLSYLARCDNTPDGCASAHRNKSALLWTKIDNSGPALLNQQDGPPGQWSSHVMIANNNSWSVHIPEGLAPGPYVLRHEAIALHFAKDKGGAQNYPLCVNLWVTPPARPVEVPFKLEGVAGTGLYREDDPGIWIDVFRSLTTYVVPGPTVAAGADPVPLERQAKSVPVREGTPVRVEGTRTVPWVAKRTGEVFRGVG